MEPIRFYQITRLLVTGMLLGGFIFTVNGQEWQSLVHGKDLKNWKQLGGKAPYRLENGIIIGTTIANTPNSFLTTVQDYGDFILEFEVWVDPDINSGVQIRSLSDPNYREGRVHGYQVELDPSPRAFSGGIYDEGRRMWLYPLSRNPKGRAAFRNGQWNKVHVEAIGSTIRTWVNGVQCAFLTDDLTPRGFIGLQVHSIDAPELAGRQVKWRSIRIMTNGLEPYRWDLDPDVPEISYLVNQLTEREKRLGWRLLWDGVSSQGWRSARSAEFPSNGWVMNDGVLTIQGTDGGESTGPGDIVTVDQYSDFELELEFKLTTGANSGIKYFVQPELNQGAGSAIGCEYQLLDDDGHPDANMGVNGNRRLAGLYDMIAPENLSVPGRGKQFKGLDQWNKARIVSHGGKVTHWLNNEKTVEYHRFSQMFRALVAYSKYNVWEGFGQWPKGHILLQDHGNEVHFRSIKIREL